MFLFKIICLAVIAKGKTMSWGHSDHDWSPYTWSKGTILYHPTQDLLHFLQSHICFNSFKAKLKRHNTVPPVWQQIRKIKLTPYIVFLAVILSMTVSLLLFLLLEYVAHNYWETFSWKHLKKWRGNWVLLAICSSVQPLKCFSEQGQQASDEKRTGAHWLIINSQIPNLSCFI